MEQCDICLPLCCWKLTRTARTSLSCRFLPFPFKLPLELIASLFAIVKLVASMGPTIDKSITSIDLVASVELVSLALVMVRVVLVMSVLVESLVEESLGKELVGVV
jgi:hypothetical protein